MTSATPKRSRASWALIVLASVLIAGCGGTDKPTNPKPAASPQPLSTETFVGHMKRSNAAVDEFMGVLSGCVDTPGCALEERSEALGLIDASMRAAGPFENADPEACAQAFSLIRDGLQRQYRAVATMQDAAGNADASSAASKRMDRATDTIAEAVAAISDGC